MFIENLRQGTAKLKKKNLKIIINEIKTKNRNSKDASKQTAIKCKM
jgi:hypothetical protein